MMEKSNERRRRMAIDFLLDEGRSEKARADDGGGEFSDKNTSGPTERRNNTKVVDEDKKTISEAKRGEPGITPSSPKVSAREEPVIKSEGQRQFGSSDEEGIDHVSRGTQDRSVIPRCSVQGCDNYPKSGGRCISHGGGKRCAEKGCNSSTQSRGLCKKHGGGKKCLVEGCNKGAVGRSRCVAHGGGKKCMKCTNAAVSNGLCIAHGGGKRCQQDGCTKGAKKGGFCIGHGGGRRCEVEGCERSAQRHNRCKSHGGGVTCKVEACLLRAVRSGYCRRHESVASSSARSETPRQGEPNARWMQTTSTPYHRPGPMAYQYSRDMHTGTSYEDRSRVLPPADSRLGMPVGERRFDAPRAFRSGSYSRAGHHYHPYPEYATSNMQYQYSSEPFYPRTADWYRPGVRSHTSPIRGENKPVQIRSVVETRTAEARYSPRRGSPAYAHPLHPVGQSPPYHSLQYDQT